MIAPAALDVTLCDKYRIAQRLVSTLLGSAILWRSMSIAISPLAILIGLAFICFGGYRLWLEFIRLKQFKNASHRNSK